MSFRAIPSTVACILTLGLAALPAPAQSLIPRDGLATDGHLVAYSLGNFATYGKFNLSGFMGTSLVLEVVLDAKGTLVTGKILPTRLIGKGIPEPDPDGTSIDLIRASSDTDFPDTAPLIGRDGTIGVR